MWKDAAFIHVTGAAAAPGRITAVERSCPTAKVGAVAALCWNSCEEIAHVQGQRNPSEMVGAERGHQRADTLKP